MNGLQIMFAIFALVCGVAVFGTDDEIQKGLRVIAMLVLCVLVKLFEKP